MSRHDVMIGSRYVPGGGSAHWPLSRRLISRSLNTLVRVLMRIPVRDASGAFRCYRVGKLRQTDLTRLRSRGYSFQQEVLYRCRKAGCKFGETPIIFENRRAGTSKVNLKEAVRSLGVILLVGVAAFFGFD
jgi:dolichol-phosphate mannosyltransferase